MRGERVGRIYNHYQWCGWVDATVKKTAGAFIVGKIDFRITVIGWGSYREGKTTVEVYIDEVRNWRKDVTAENTTFTIKPFCRQLTGGGTCNQVAPMSATIASLRNGAPLTAVTTVNLPPSSSGNVDRQMRFEAGFAFEGFTTAFPGHTVSFGETKPVVRCDGSLRKFETPACIYEVFPSYFMNTNNASISEVAKHVKFALEHPNDTMPPDPNGVIKRIPDINHRSVDDDLRKRQRDASVKACAESLPPRPPGGYECDEFPPAATYEGSLTVLGNQFSVAWVIGIQNSSEGGTRGNWYTNDRILDNDPYLVRAYDGPPVG